MDRSTLTHINEQGRARMVDVGEKEATNRVALARSRIHMRSETGALIRHGRIHKGDVPAVAQVAGIQAAKKTWELIPMCHPLILSSVDIEFEFLSDERLEIRTTVKNVGQTGVEMEALTAASVAALTVYDMCKAVDPAMRIEETCLLQKSGGKSGTHVLEEGPSAGGPAPGPPAGADAGSKKGKQALKE